MRIRLHNFCRGYGSVGQLQPHTATRHVFISHPIGGTINEESISKAVNEHFQGCWNFVTGNMREVALKKTV